MRDQGFAGEVRHGAERIAVHGRAVVRHQVVTNPEHHAGIPLQGASRMGKTLVHIRERAPTVEVRPLAV